MAWTVVRAVFTDVGNDALKPGGVVALLMGDEARTSRVSPTLTAVWGEVGPTFWAWLAIALVGVVLLRHRRIALGLGTAWVLPALTVSIAAALALVYIAGDQDITWWLMTSISRTTIVLRVLLLTDVFLWLLTACAASRHPAPAPIEIRRD
jgi:hypothetical protein